MAGAAMDWLDEGVSLDRGDGGETVDVSLEGVAIDGVSVDWEGVRSWLELLREHLTELPPIVA
jgi:hypothetical protein